MTFRTIALASVAAVALGGQSWAQSKPASGAEEATTVAEVIVTSGKREQSLQEVPASVSAFSAKDRDVVGISTIQDVTNFAPGLDYNTSTDRLAIRGIGRNTNNLTADPGVATYVDGVYSAQTFTAAGDPLFVQRIEVLRGPEGTLYGRNSIGGAINAISKRPSSEFGGEVRASVANYARTSVAATVTGPITEGVSFRLNGSMVNQEQGYFRNVTGLHSEGGNTYGWFAEGQLSAKLGEKFDLWLKVSDRYWDTATRSSVPTGPLDKAPSMTGTSVPGANYVYCAATDAGNPYGCYAGVPTHVNSLPGAVGYNPADVNLRTFQSNQYGHTTDRDNYTVSTEAVWHLPIADLKYIGGYQHYYLNIDSGFFQSGVLSYDYPCSGVGCTPVHTSAVVPFFWIEDKSFWSHELNLTSTGSGPVQWIAGLYSYGESYNQPVNYSVPDAPYLTQLVLPYGNIEGPTRTVDYYNTVAHGKSYAGFGQVDWQVTPKIKLTGGLRYTVDMKRGQESTRQLYALIPGFAGAPYTVINLTPGAGFVGAPPITKGVGPVTVDPATGIGYRDYKDHFSATTGTAGVEYKPADGMMVYAKYSRGYKSGGFNTGFLAPNPETKPEFVNAYEVGFKGVIGNQLRLNASAYSYDYLNDQIPLSVSVLNSPAQTQFFNIPKVRAQGFELEALWSPTDRTSFTLAYDYAEATIRSVVVNGVKQCFSDGADPHAVQPGANIAGCSTAGPTASRAQDVTGATLPQTPKGKIALNAQHRFDVAGGGLTVSANYIWRGKTYSSIFNRDYNLAPAYDQVDLRALWSDKDNRYTVIAYVKNAFDKVGYDGVSARLLTSSYAYLTDPSLPQTPVLGRTLSLTPPRTFGVELQHRF